MQQLVVGFADIETARHAVREAAQLAVRLSASLHVVTAIERDTSEVIEVGSDRWHLGTGERVEHAIRELMDALPQSPQYTVAVHEGKPADLLIREAEAQHADLIVVGNARMQGPGRLLGSVGNAVAHHAPCSVLIIKTV